MSLITRFLDPKNDFAFKRIFGSEKHKKLLMSFLNAVLQNQLAAPIQSLTFLKPAQDPELAAKKQSIVDVLCRDKAGVQYIVEMQVASQAGFEERAQYYASKAYVSQMNEGDQYKALKEVIFLAIADYVVFPHKVAYKSSHCTLDQQTGENDLDKIFFTFVELPKFKARFKKEKRKLADLTLEERWYYFLSHAPSTTNKELRILSSSPPIEAAYQVLNYFNFNEREVLTYELAKKNKLDEQAIRDKIREDAEKRGMKKGIEKGMEKGIQQEKLELAKQMLQDGEAIEKMVRWTGLREEQIKQLIQ